DEEATAELKEEILKITSGSAAENIAGFYIPFRLNFLGKFIRFGGCQQEKHLRLFRRGQGQFTVDAVHEKMAVDGKIGHLNSLINHYSYDNLEDYFSKLNCYTSLAAIKLKNKGKKFHFWQIFLPPWVFFQKYFLKLGFFDGWAGFLWAILSGVYVFVKYLKLWELQQPKSKTAA
ncbi:MAG: glycosyltransferase family 2 protein, partial [Elusimicrobiota bacterium]